MIDRTQLQAANAAVKELKEKVTALETAYARSTDAVADAETKLGVVSSSGSELVLERVAQLKGDGSLKALPSVKLLARAQAAEEVELAHTAHATLKSELGDARNRLAIAESKRFWEAVRILYAFAEPTITELAALNQRRHELRNTLRALVNHRVEKNRPTDLLEPAGLHGVLIDVEPHVIGSPGEAMLQRWEKRVDALLENPDATVDFPPYIQPDDAIIFPSPVGSNRLDFRGYTVR